MRAAVSVCTNAERLHERLPPVDSDIPNVLLLLRAQTLA